MALHAAPPPSAVGKDLSGKVALVTGAARGIGRAVSKVLGQHGASIVMGDILSDMGEMAARTLSSQGLTTRFMTLDTRAEWDIQRFVSHAIQVFGRIDIVVTCAGVVRVTPLAEITPEHFHAVFDTNVLGTALVIKHTAPKMEKTGGGTIVTVSSISAMMGFPDMSLYCASKAAVVGLTRSAAVELAPKKIRVNSILPSWVDTDMIEEEMNAREQLGQGGGDRILEKSLSVQPIPKMATADEVAEVICFLASPANSLLTGACLTYDGGLHCI